MRYNWGWTDGYYAAVADMEKFLLEYGEFSLKDFLIHMSYANTDSGKSPFNLCIYKFNPERKLITRGGKRATITDISNEDGKAFPITVVLEDKTAYKVTPSGKWMFEEVADERDIFFDNSDIKFKKGEENEA